MAFVAHRRGHRAAVSGCSAAFVAALVLTLIATRREPAAVRAAAAPERPYVSGCDVGPLPTGPLPESRKVDLPDWEEKRALAYEQRIRELERKLAEQLADPEVQAMLREREARRRAVERMVAERMREARLRRARCPGVPPDFACPPEGPRPSGQTQGRARR